MQMPFKGSDPKVNVLFNGSQLRNTRRLKQKIEDGKIYISLEDLSQDDGGKYELCANNASGKGRVIVEVNVLGFHSDQASLPPEIPVKDYGKVHSETGTDAMPTKVRSSSLPKTRELLTPTSGSNTNQLKKTSEVSKNRKSLRRKPKAADSDVSSSSGSSSEDDYGDNDTTVPSKEDSIIDDLVKGVLSISITPDAAVSSDESITEVQQETVEAQVEALETVNTAADEALTESAVTDTSPQVLASADMFVVNIMILNGGNWIPWRKKMKIEEFMKYNFVLNNCAYFAKATSFIETSQFRMSCENGILYIDPKAVKRPDKREYISHALNCILASTADIVVNSWPVTGADTTRVIDQIKMSEMGKQHEICIHLFRDLIHVAYNKANAEQVCDVVSKALKRNKTFVDKTDIPYVFCVILNNSEWEAKLKIKYPNILAKWKTVDDKDAVEVTFKGYKEEVKGAMDWFEKNVILEYGFCDLSFSSIPELEFSQPAEILLEYLKLKYENQNEIQYAVNIKTQKIWLSSRTSEGEASKEKKSLQQKGGIVKSVTIPLEGKFQEEETNEDIEHVQKSCMYVSVKVTEKGIIVKGLEKYVNETKKKIKEVLDRKLKKKATQIKDSFELKDVSLLHYFQDKNVLKGIAVKHNVQFSPFCNNKKAGLYYEGECEDCKEFVRELEGLVDRVETQNIDIVLDKTTCSNSTDLDELLHKIEVEQDGLVRVQKCKGRNAASAVIRSTMKEDLQDCLYAQWEVRDTCTITCIETRLDFPWSDVVFVPVYEGSDCARRTERTGTTEKFFVPIPTESTYKAKHKVESNVAEALEKVKKKTCYCISAQVMPINTWARYGYVKGILRALWLWQLKQEKSRIDIVFCCLNRDAYVYSSDICRGAIPGDIKPKEVKPINKGQYLDEFKISVVKEEISNVTADVVVNTTSNSLDLSYGAVSAMLLNCAGQELQDAVLEKNPDGIGYGEIVQTEAFNLKNCRYVFHGAMDIYRKQADFQKLEDFVYKCFEEANMKGCASIALPAIGTGNLDFPKQGVAETMFGAAKKYFRDQHPSTLRCVKFVVYHKDRACLKAFKDQEKVWGTFLKCQSDAIVYGGIRLQLDYGCLARPGTDAMMYLLDNGKIYSTFSSNSLLLCCGDEVKEKIVTHMKMKSDQLLKFKGGEIKAEIFYMPCQNSLDSIYQAVFECLLTADKHGTVHSICIAFDKTHSFLLRDGLVQTLCKVIKDASQETKNIDQVVIWVETARDLDKMLDHFKTEGKDSSTEEKHVRIELYGFVDQVKAAVAKLKEHFPVTQQGETGDATVLPSKEPEEETGQDDSAVKKQTENVRENRHIEPCEIFARYVEVLNVPKGHDKESLRTEIFKEGLFPVRLPKLVYCKGSEKALLLCQSEKDAVQLSGFTDLEPFVFRHVKGMALSFLISKIDDTVIQKFHQEKTYEKFKKDLKFAGIDIRGERPFEIVAPTSYQYKVAKLIVEEFRHIGVTSSKEEIGDPKTASSTSPYKANDFQNVESMKDVDENVWEVVSCSEEYRKLKGKCKGISYSERSIIIELSDEGVSQEVRQMEKIVKNLKEKEMQEIQTQETNSETVNQWCSEIKDVLGYDCCKYIDGKNKVIAYCNNYDDFVKLKHIFGMKTGQIKQTGKGRRQRKTEDVLDKEYTSLTFPSEEEPQGHQRNQDRRTFEEKYKTIEDIKVLVYEANILNLPVDCIVNAANDTLQHGGGVAYVIAKAAGRALTEEGDKHIRQIGSVPVGTTFTTTAGKLQYDCVIHAVGPRWYDYNPHTLKKVQECEEHLYQAVYNSFLAAERRGLKSIALPAISSAIFGVPEEICVYQYAKATADYSRKTVNQPTALKEIHFIDKNYNIVQKIQACFRQVFWEGNMPYYDSNSHVKSHSSQRSYQDNSRSSGGNQPRHRHGHAGHQNSQDTRHAASHRKSPDNSRSSGGTHSSYPKQKHGQSGPQTSAAETTTTFSEPLSYFDNKYSVYTYLLSGKEEHELLLSRGDMFSTTFKSTVVVIPVGIDGKQGQIARTLVTKMPSYKVSEYKFRVSCDSKDKNLSDVFLTDGFDSGYRYILHAVYPAISNERNISERKQFVLKLYDSIFSICTKHTGISSVVTTLLGTGMKPKDDVKSCAEIFLQSYLQNCLKLPPTNRLRIHLVCREEMVYDAVKDVLDNYVRKEKERHEQKLQKTNQSDETATVNQKDQEFDSCVICMDSITNPRTLDCGHTFCTDCIEQQFSFKEACPTCGQVCGTITGDQPEGQMRVAFSNSSYCVGYETCGQIVITYNFSSGKQGQNHPNPGKWYKGITRMAYLPNNEEGQKILAMLKVAFERKLVFTIGSSRTTGEEGVITWNDIHHKTDHRPNRQFGYPDPGYLERVKDELAVKGITEKDIPKGKGSS